MKRTAIFVLLLVACALGVGVNVLTVISRERSLANDAIWRFRIEGYDPLDPFRGRYIEFTTPDLLALEPGQAGASGGDEGSETGSAGAIEIGAIEIAAEDDEDDESSRDAPVEAEYDPLTDVSGGYPSWLHEGDWFYASLERDREGYARIARATFDEPAVDGAWLKLRYLGDGAIEPVFTRYYVNEAKADDLDRRFANARGGAYVTVRVSRGVGVIEGVGFAD